MIQWLRNLFGRRPADSGEAKVRLYPYPFVGLLDELEKNKGAHLTRDEVLAARDNAHWIEVTPTQADKFHAAFFAETGLPKLDPDRIWEEWQALNGREP